MFYMLLCVGYINIKNLGPDYKNVSHFTELAANDGISLNNVTRKVTRFYKVRCKIFFRYNFHLSYSYFNGSFKINLDCSSLKIFD